MSARKQRPGAIDIIDEPGKRFVRTKSWVTTAEAPHESGIPATWQTLAETVFRKWLMCEDPKVP